MHLIRKGKNMLRGAACVAGLWSTVAGLSLGGVACVQAAGPLTSTPPSQLPPRPSVLKASVHVFGADPYKAAQTALLMKSSGVQIGVISVDSPLEPKPPAPFDAVRYYVSRGRMSRVRVTIMEAPGGKEKVEQTYKAILRAGEVSSASGKEQESQAKTMVLIKKGSSAGVQATVDVPAAKGKWGKWVASFVPSQESRNGKKTPLTVLGLLLPFHVPPAQLPDALRSGKLRPDFVWIEKPELALNDGRAIKLDYLCYKDLDNKGSISSVSGSISGDAEKSREKIGKLYETIRASGKILQDEKRALGGYRLRMLVQAPTTNQKGIVEVEWMFMGWDKTDPGWLKFQVFPYVEPKADSTAPNSVGPRR